MPYDELDTSGLKIEGVKWAGATLRANFGEGYGAAALVGNAAGLHEWTLRRSTLPGDSSIVPIDAKSRLDYYLDFFKEHTTGTTEIFIITWRGKKYHASFADPDMDVAQVTFRLYDPEIYQGGGLKIKQRRVAGTGYSSDGSIDEIAPCAPIMIGTEAVDEVTVRLTFYEPDDDCEGVPEMTDDDYLLMV